MDRGLAGYGSGTELDTTSDLYAQNALIFKALLVYRRVDHEKSLSVLECYLKLNQPSFFMLWSLSAGSTLDLKCHSLVTPAALCFNFPVWAFPGKAESELAGWNPTALNSGSGY